MHFIKLTILGNMIVSGFVSSSHDTVKTNIVIFRVQQWLRQHHCTSKQLHLLFEWTHPKNDVKSAVKHDSNQLSLAIPEPDFST
jgi:hypothetical protein